MKERHRIISLAPTQTEILVALGQMENLIGVTENCDYPAEVKRLPHYGSWHAPDLPGILGANPDLVCTFGRHQEEMAASLREEGLEVYHGDPPTIAASLRTIEELAERLECRELGAELLRRLNGRLETVGKHLGKADSWNRPSVLRIMNWEPLVTVGPGAFQHDVIEAAGGQNIMEDGPAPYFTCEPKVVQERDPRVIFFCEAFIKEALRRDSGWQRVDAVRNGRLFVFDCGLTCRSGPRIVDMVEELARALHPELW